ncbi:hypothetical protein GCM10028820_02730 [Tessaracoccus terricola]
MAEPVVGPAAWTTSLPVDVAASVYALPPELRVAGAGTAHRAGQWVHADVILRRDADGNLHNTGVDTGDVGRILRKLPGVRVEVHLMVLADGPDVAQAVADVGRSLQGLGVRRWVARSEVLAWLAPSIADGVERWVEVSGAPGQDDAAADGFLVMLIEPGTKGVADPAAIDVVAELAGGRGRVGVDGGVTPEVAASVVAAGGRHLVVGRALWGDA